MCFLSVLCVYFIVVIFKQRSLMMQGRMQDRYTIVERKDRNLFKAQSKVGEKQVMIKKISFSSISPKTKEHIVNEVNTLVRMNYIHILRYLDYEINKEDITVDIVMEYCEGGTLQKLISKARGEKKKIEEGEVWKIFYQLAQAIDYIHRDGIIHRNINPSNIYFRDAQRKNIKMGGFSLSKRLVVEETLSSTVLPNTYYLSPEQIESGICTIETDIWALGCLMYEVCMLQSPFKHTNQFERVKMIRECRPKEISNSYSKELRRVIYWCLEKNAEDRPTLPDILGAPEINMRIRERRYQQKNAQLASKQQLLNKRQRQQIEQQNQLQNTRLRYESQKRKGSEMGNSKHNIGLLKYTM